VRGLVLTLQEGGLFTVGLTEVTVTKIVSADTFLVRVDGQEIELGPDEWTTLFPGCMARSTLPKDPTQKVHRVRVQVNAPAYRIQLIKA